MRSDVVVLCFHAISARRPAALSVTPESFSAQVRFLHARGYRGTTFTEAVLDPPFRRTVAVTFDDGYRSVLEHGLTILSAVDWPATLFVATTFVGAGRPMSWPGIDQWLAGPHEGELMPLDWDGVRSLAAHGWEIGSHTCTHPRLSQVSDEVLRRELRESRARCERELDRPCFSLAYPYGDVGSREVRAAAQAGYRAGAALPRRFDSSHPLESPRVGIWHSDDGLTFRLKVSPSVRRMRATRAWPALDGARDRYGAAKRAIRRRRADAAG